MIFIRKVFTLFLVASVVFSLVSCGLTKPTEQPDDSAAPFSEDELPEEELPDPEPAGYTGTLKGYEYRYNEGRDREWEEDVLHLANKVITFHPFMTEKCWCDGRDPHFSYDLYDPELRELFISEINTLIDRIPELEEFEIIYELQRIVTLLNDGHTRMSTYADSGSGGYMPLVLREFYEDGDAVIYAIGVPKTEERLLYAKLTAINGIPIDEVLTRLFDYTYGENTYWKTHVAARNEIIDTDLLSVAGIMEFGETSAMFSFLTADGEKVEVELTSTPYSQNRTGSMTIKTLKSFGSLMYQHDDLNYWNTYIEEDNIVYIRYNSCYPMASLSYSDFWTQVMNTVHAAEEPPKVVFDLRENGGGYSGPSGFSNFIAGLNNLEINGLYVLIDVGTFSAGVNAAAEFSQFGNNAVLVGSPAGQAPNILGPASPQKLPNSGCEFDLSDRLIVWWPDYEGDILNPDITLYPNIEDYKQGVDTVFEAVRGF